MRIISFILIFLMVSCGDKKTVVTVVDAHNNNDADFLDLRWSNSDLPIKIYISNSFEVSVQNAIINAMETWNNAIGFNVLEYEIVDDIYDYTSIEAFLNDGFSSVAFPTMWPAESVNALASTSFARIGNRIIKGDVMFNTTNPNYSFTASLPLNNKVDIESVVLHEFGHLLGLNHVETSEDNNSVMNPVFGKNQLKRVLSDKDVENILKKY